MQIVDIHEAKTHLYRLVEQVAKGGSFVIAKAGKQLVKVSALDSPTGDQVRRVGFLSGHIKVPDDFDMMGSEEVVRRRNAFDWGG